MNFYQADFPFEEVDRFDSQREAINAGNDTNQIWSVVIDDDTNSYCYGPSHHYVNLLYYIVTKERHNDNTYYEEEGIPCIDDDDLLLIGVQS
tara:strand:+ start:667 stop:942 length:276 start_codon:yes stop_codon:yes gene_type:complete